MAFSLTTNAIAISSNPRPCDTKFSSIFAKRRVSDRSQARVGAPAKPDWGRKEIPHFSEHDLRPGLRDIVGGRSAGYEESLRQARETAIGELMAEAEQLGADAFVGVDVDYESIRVGQGGSMLMVSASATAVKP